MIVIAKPAQRLRAAIHKYVPAGEIMEVDDLHKLDKFLAAHSGETDAVFLGAGVEPEEAFAVAARLQLEAPEVSVIKVSTVLAPDDIYAAMRAGIRDVLPEDFSLAQLRDALERATSLSRALRGRNGVSPYQAGEKGRVVTVFSGKGGCGKSFTSVNLAILLAQNTGKEVALVDLDLQSGDLGIMLQLDPKWTISDAVARLDGLDAEELRGYLTPHTSGVRLLAAPFEPQEAEAISADSVHAILSILRETFSYVVVDGPSFFTEPLLSAVDGSDECVLVTSMDVPSIKNLKVSLRTLNQLGVPRDQLWLVLNRADSKVGLHIRQVEESLETQIDVSFPSSRDVPLSINQGIPLAIQNRKSPVVAAVGKLAAMVQTGATGQIRSRVS